MHPAAWELYITRTCSHFSWLKGVISSHIVNGLSMDFPLFLRINKSRTPEQKSPKVSYFFKRWLSKVHFGADQWIRWSTREQRANPSPNPKPMGWVRCSDTQGRFLPLQQICHSHSSNGILKPSERKILPNWTELLKTRPDICNLLQWQKS